MIARTKPVFVRAFLMEKFLKFFLILGRKMLKTKLQYDNMYEMIDIWMFCTYLIITNLI